MTRRVVCGAFASVCAAVAIAGAAPNAVAQLDAAGAQSEPRSVAIEHGQYGAAMSPLGPRCPDKPGVCPW